MKDNTITLLKGQIVKNTNLADGTERVVIDFGDLPLEYLTNIINLRRQGECMVLFLSMEDAKIVLDGLNNNTENNINNDKEDINAVQD